MREIKFRAWYEEEKEMQSVRDIYFNKNKGDIESFVTKGKKATYNTDVHTHNLMQYTGLKDKNGVEIYEGDMLKVFENGRFGGEYLAPISFVEFENNGESWSFFGFACLDVVEISHHIEVDSLFNRGFLMRKFGSCVQLSELTKDTKNSLEVIGNIYENPELLEKE